MKKLGSLVAVFVLSANVSANEAGAALSNLTIAAADTGSTISWTIEKAENAFESRLEKSIEERAEALSRTLNERLERSLEEKFNNELNF